MARQNYDALMKKASNIKAWLPDLIDSRYRYGESAGKDYFFGHLFERHFERDSEYLKNRALRKKGSATAFFLHGEKGRAAICKMVVNALLDEYNLEDIACWLADGQDDDFLEIETDQRHPVGHGYAYINGEAVHKTSSKIRIILEKKKRTNEFTIQTVYPVL